MLPVTGCAALTPAFFACLFSTSSEAESCRTEALAPGPPSTPAGVRAGFAQLPGEGFNIELTWSRSPEPDVREYHVYSAATSGGPRFRRGCGAGPLGCQPAFYDLPEVLALDFGVGPCRTAYYVVSAVDVLGQDSPVSPEVSAPTPCYGPRVPAGLTATPGERRVLLDWDDRDDPDLAGYDIYRGEIAEVGERVSLVKVNGAPVTASEYEDLHVTSSTEYVYRVAAVSRSGGSSALSGVISSIPDVTPEDHLRDVTATPGNASVRLEWDHSLAPSNVVGFNVYRGRNLDENVTKVNDEVVTDLAYVDTGLVNRTEYFYRLTVVFRSGFESRGAMVSATPFDATLAAPTGVTATAGDRSVQLDWDDSGTSALAGYNVYRAEQASGPFAKVNSELVAASEYLVAGLLNGTEYFFQVTAVDGTGDESDPSAVVAATPVGADEKPAAPTGLTATHSGEDVWLDWDDNREADLASYNVYESQRATGPFGRVASVNGSEYFIVETPNIEFFYYVTAVDQAGQESDASATVRAAPCPPTGCAPTLSGFALLRRGTTTASSDHGWFPFELTISGDYRQGGRSRVENDRLVGHGFVYEGTFELTAPSRLPAAGLGGTWRSTTDWVLEPGAGKGRATGVALATFADPEAGRACLRFEETYTAKKSSKGAEVVTRGTFALLGGTGEAAKQLGKGTYRVRVHPDGRVNYEGKARAVQGALPAAPAECQGR